MYLLIITISLIIVYPVVLIPILVVALLGDLASRKLSWLGPAVEHSSTLCSLVVSAPAASTKSKYKVDC